MKIQSIQSNNKQSNKKQLKNNYTEFPQKSSTNDQFIPVFGIATGRTSGGSNYLNYPVAWSASKLRILSRTRHEMEDLAEYFHDKSNSALDAVAKRAHWLSESNYRAASARLIEFVTPIRAKKISMDARASKLEARGYLSQSERQELNSLKAEIERLETKAANARDNFEAMISW